MSVFKVTLCVSHFFFFKRKKSIGGFFCFVFCFLGLFFVFCFLWWWINNTKRSLVKEKKKKSKSRGIVNFQVLGLFVEVKEKKKNQRAGGL